MAQSELILANQMHPGDSTAQTTFGEKFKGDGYYGRSDGLHTVQYSVTGFTGTVAVQATLAVNPVEADWFTVYTESHLTTTKTIVENFTGNYVWLRAAVSSWTDGSVDSILLNH
jgi:hypothetical protein